MAASQVISGARAILKVGADSKAVGYCLGVNGTTGINYQPLRVIGHLEVMEHVPVEYNVEMTANLARMANYTRLAGGAAFPGHRADDAFEGGTDSPQIMPAFGTNGDPILKAGEMSASLWDRVTKKTLVNIAGLKCQNKGWDVAPSSSSAENCSFVARIANETGENVTTELGA